jgi:hypothetical protein
MPRASIIGAQGSCLVLTNRRAIRWRPPGATLSVPLTSVERLEVRSSRQAGRALILIVPGEGTPALALVLEAHQVPSAAPFAAALAEAVVAAGGRTARPVEVEHGPVELLDEWFFRRP